MEFPRFVQIEQKLYARRVRDVSAATVRGLPQPPVYTGA